MDGKPERNVMTTECRICRMGHCHHRPGSDDGMAPPAGPESPPAGLCLRSLHARNGAAAPQPGHRGTYLLKAAGYGGHVCRVPCCVLACRHTRCMSVTAPKRWINGQNPEHTVIIDLVPRTRIQIESETLTSMASRKSVNVIHAAPKATPKATTHVQGMEEEIDYREEWPDTVYMYLPLDELYNDWQAYVQSSAHQDTEEGVEMRRVLQACAKKWRDRLREVEHVLDADAATLASSFIQYRDLSQQATAKSKTAKRPTSAEQYLDMLHFQRRYLTEAVGITEGREWSASKSEIIQSRSSFRTSSNACSLQ